MSDPLISRLAELPTAQPDRERAQRIRMRCRARLVRRTRPSTPRVNISRVWWPALTVLGVVYVIAAIVQAFSLLSSRF